MTHALAHRAPVADLPSGLGLARPDGRNPDRAGDLPPRPPPRRATGWRLLGYAPAEAIALLGAIIPAALTMVVLILSMLLLAVQLAASSSRRA